MKLDTIIPYLHDIIATDCIAPFMRKCEREKGGGNETRTPTKEKKGTVFKLILFQITTEG